MVKRVTTKIGDVFCVELKNGSIRCFQYVANDMTQLNSEVLRVFKTTYHSSVAPIIGMTVRDTVDFHMHSDTRAGIKMGCWKKMGNAPVHGEVGTLFIKSDDIGNPALKLSTRWHVWRANKPMQYVGALNGANRESEPGSVFPPFAIVNRLETGSYGFFEHAFE